MVRTDQPESRDRWFIGTRLRVIADAEATGGQLTVMEQWAPAGFSPPLHIHGREDTALHVLVGELTVRVGDVDREVRSGEMVWLPREVPHTFLVRSEVAHLLEYATPAGIEDFHIETSEPAVAEGLPAPSEPDVPRLVEAFARHGGQILGPPMID